MGWFGNFHEVQTWCDQKMLSNLLVNFFCHTDWSHQLCVHVILRRIDTILHDFSKWLWMCSAGRSSWRPTATRPTSNSWRGESATSWTPSGINCIKIGPELLKDHWSFRKIKDQDQLSDLDHHPLKDRFKFIDLDQRSDHSKRSLNINRLLCWPKKCSQRWLES